MAIRKIGVLGCGQMGGGIAQITAAAGYEVIVREITDELWRKGFARIDKSLAKFVEKEKMTGAQKDQTMARLAGTTDLARFADCDLVIEAVIENFDEKVKLLKELDHIAKPEAIFASNTSSLAVGDIAAHTSRPGRFCGLHFFNPVPLMKLVEVVRTLSTTDETYAAAKTFAESVGKVVVTARDTPGFVVNLLLVPYLLDAARAYEAGVASRDDIDNGMKLGCGHPMGPLALLDFIGLDTIYYIAEIMFNEFKDRRYAAPPILKRMVNAGFLGKKSGRGFYAYTE